MTNLRFGQDSTIEYLGAFRNGASLYGQIRAIFNGKPPVNIPKKWLITADQAVQSGNFETDEFPPQPNQVFVLAEFRIDLTSETAEGVRDLQQWFELLGYLRAIDGTPQLEMAYVFADTGEEE